MKCRNCGFETSEQINFCPVCATQFDQTSQNAGTETLNQPSQSDYSYSQVQQTNYNNEEQVSTGSYIFDIKDFFSGNVTMLVLSSLLVLSCCFMNIFAIGGLVVSIIGVVKSNKVKNNILSSRYELAQNDSKVAKTLFYVGLALVITAAVATIVYYIFYFAIFINAMNNLNNINTY